MPEQYRDKRTDMKYVSCYIHKSVWTLLRRKMNREMSNRSGVMRRAIYAYCKDELTKEEKRKAKKKPQSKEEKNDE